MIKEDKAREGNFGEIRFNFEEKITYFQPLAVKGERSFNLYIINFLIRLFQKFIYGQDTI